MILRPIRELKGYQTPSFNFLGQGGGGGKQKLRQAKEGHPGKKKGLFQMTDISPCVGTLWHGLTSEYNKRKSHRFHWN